MTKPPFDLRITDGIKCVARIRARSFRYLQVFGSHNICSCRKSIVVSDIIRNTTCQMSHSHIENAFSTKKDGPQIRDSHHAPSSSSPGPWPPSGSGAGSDSGSEGSTTGSTGSRGSSRSDSTSTRSPLSIMFSVSIYGARHVQILVCPPGALITKNPGSYAGGAPAQISPLEDPGGPAG